MLEYLAAKEPEICIWKNTAQHQISLSIDINVAAARYNNRALCACYCTRVWYVNLEDNAISVSLLVVGWSFVLFVLFFFFACGQNK